MLKSLKLIALMVAVLSSVSCIDTLDTSSDIAKQQSINKMMVGLHPDNQRRFKHALNILYTNDKLHNSNLSQAESSSFTDSRLAGKNVEEILYLSFLSKKTPLKMVTEEVLATSPKDKNNSVKVGFNH